MIESIRLRNFLSFGPEATTVKLRAVNILIGANGTGKSNLLDGLRFLRATTTKLSDVLQGGPANFPAWVWKGEREDERAAVEVRFARTREFAAMNYRIDITAKESGFLVFLELIQRTRQPPDVFREPRSGTLHLKGAGRTPARDTFDVGESILSQLRDPMRYPVLEHVRRSLGAIHMLADPLMGRGSALHRPQRADALRVDLSEDGSNLAVVLGRLFESGLKSKFEQYVREVYPSIERVELIPKGGYAEIAIEEGVGVIPASRLSDGTLRWMFLTAALLDPLGRDSTICIDEPELGLHPDAMTTLAELLREASESRQLVLTTHSDHLLDKFTDEPESVLVVEKQDGESRVERLSKKRLASWLDECRLGQVWRSGEFGGNRW
jgi:predicted ATPase